MKKYFPLLFLLISFSCSQNETMLTVIRNVTVIDAVNGERTNQTIVINDTNIQSVGTDDEINYSGNARVIDGTGKFLIPGLWDMHVHLTYEQDLSPAMFDLFLVHGITGVRDTGGLIELIMPWKEKSLRDENAPRVMVAGPLLDGIPTVYNGEGGRPKIGLGAGSPEEAVALVDSFVNAGVDLIKSYEMLSPETFKAVVERSRESGKVVTGHVPLSMDVIEASNAGLRSMEHMRNLSMACSRDYDSLLNARKEMLKNVDNLAGGDLRSNIHNAQRPHAVMTQDAERRAEVLKSLATNETWQIPTLTILAAMENRVFDRESWRGDFKYLPETVSKRWTENALRMTNNPSNENQLNYANWGYGMINQLDSAGVVMMAGTDTPIFFLTPGVSLHEELRLLVKSGLSPLKTLEAATLNPARYFKMADELGSIDPGKIADLVLLDANPLTDITNTMKINTVVRQGKVFNREALDVILSKLENQ